MVQSVLLELIKICNLHTSVATFQNAVFTKTTLFGKLRFLDVIYQLLCQISYKILNYKSDPPIKTISTWLNSYPYCVYRNSGPKKRPTPYSSRYRY